MNTNLNNSNSISNSIKLTGRFEIPEGLEIGTNYTITLDAEITSISKHSQEDGSYEYVHTAKPVTGEIIANAGKVLKLGDKKKQSVKLRQQLGFIARERGIDEETFYNETLTDFRHYTLEILDFLKGIKNV